MRVVIRPVAGDLLKHFVLGRGVSRFPFQDEILGHVAGRGIVAEVEHPQVAQCRGIVGVFVDANRASDVVSYGLGAGALVAGLALFAYATRKDGPVKKPTKS